MLAVQCMPLPMFPTSKSPIEWIPELTENCAVCGDRVNSNRLGSPACLGCIVFFRRSVIHSSKYRCLRDGNCLINYEFRSSCRFCRFQKCFQVGMKESAVRRRDCIGPRRQSPSYSDPPILYPETDTPLIDRLVKIQKKQFEDHEEQSVDVPRRANVSDVNKMLKWSFNNAIEWASQFDPFRKLTNESQKCVLSEYGVAFFVIDQGFKSQFQKGNQHWMLQNGTYFHSDVLYEIKEDSRGAETWNHHNFVKTLQLTIQKTFQMMNITSFEIAALKSLLLVWQSFSKPNIFSDYRERMTTLKNKCFSELMEYLISNHPETHVERFGELLLILGEIRSAVKLIYNQTKTSDLFDSTQFDPFVRSFLLS